MGHLHSVSTLQRSSKLRPLFIATSSPLRMWKYFSAAFLFFGFKLHDPFQKALDLRWKVCFVLLAFSLFAHTFPIGIFFQLISLFSPPSLSLVQCTLEKRSTKSALLSTCPRPNDCNRLGKLFGYTSRKKNERRNHRKGKVELLKYYRFRDVVVVAGDDMQALLFLIEPKPPFMVCRFGCRSLLMRAVFGDFLWPKNSVSFSKEGLKFPSGGT